MVDFILNIVGSPFEKAVIVLNGFYLVN